VLTSPDGHSRKHIDRGDAAIRDHSQMRGVLLIDLDLAGDGELARYLLRHDGLDLYPNAPLGVDGDLDHIIALGATIAALIGPL
jgi:hypothetical protein